MNTALRWTMVKSANPQWNLPVKVWAIHLLMNSMQPCFPVSEKRLSGEISRTTRVKQVSPRTMNLELAYFRAVFNELKRLGHWKLDNPLINVRAFKSEEAELAYLEHEEITRLLEECMKSRNDSTYWVACLCPVTGARWDEAESITTKQIKSES